MHKNIKEILADKSDINPYGATNKAEFFAVVSEYFFERPDLLRIKHPELYKLLEQVFSNDSNTKTKKKL
jgi:Mlc titration factor MtfA (ptsG expression regulator)